MNKRKIERGATTDRLFSSSSLITMKGLCFSVQSADVSCNPELLDFAENDELISFT